ncbi:MAG: hypothetical protein DRR06_10265 [Gammaproteobacteria bacterium]|nr:MAG: hypothetical protein DRR06_10265 [Gammaproteobacteria bacterium]RLA50922.1 MAG: hypothetical protein DRR42_11770 [Gammaproteobacteria bacterium]
MADQLFPLLCGLATVSFTACARRYGQIVHWLIGFFSVFFLTGSWPGLSYGLVLIDPAHLATVAALAALTMLHKGKWNSAAVVFGGMLGAVWLNSLSALGYQWTSVLIAVCLFSFTAFFGATSRKGFVSNQLRDDAFIIVIVVALFLSTVPTAMSGWQTASNLQSLDTSQNGINGNAGVLILSLVFIILGGIYGKWKYR